MIDHYIQERDYALAWIWVVGYSVLFIIVSSVPVVVSTVAEINSGYYINLNGNGDLVMYD